MSALQIALQMAGSQHGAITDRQLRLTGTSADQTRTLVRRGVLERKGSGVLVVTGHAATLHQRMAVAALGLGAVVSHRSAASLHGIGRWPSSAPIEVLATRRRSRREIQTLGSLVLHSTTYLPPDDVDSVRSIPCTSVARTLLSLAGARELGDDRVRALVDEAVRDGKASDRWLWWRLESLRRRGRPGISRLESILAARAGGAVTESWLEREFLDVLDRHDVAAPTCQARISAKGAFAARVDFAYEGPRLAIEVNGHAHHSSPDQLARDAHRRNQLQLAGYRVLDFTYDQVVRHPETVAATVRACLLARPTAA